MGIGDRPQGRGRQPGQFQARYVNPLDPPKKVGRNFGLEYETEAYKWLDVEHYLVALHNKGIRQWVHPSQRGADTMPYSGNTPKTTSTDTANRTAARPANAASSAKWTPTHGVPPT